MAWYHRVAVAAVGDADFEIEQREGDGAVTRERPGIVRLGEQPQIVDQIRPRPVGRAGLVLEHH